MGRGRVLVIGRRFLEELVKLVPGKRVDFGKRVVDVEELGGKTGVKLHFEDGRTAEASAAVGCDGALAKGGAWGGSSGRATGVYGEICV